MEGKRTKGRQKIEMKRIENEADRLITFSKRRAGIYKKASEIVTLCGAEVGILVHSPSGKPYTFAHPSFDAISSQFLNQNHQQKQLSDDDAHIHPLVEAHRKIKIRQLTQHLNERVNQSEVEKERVKALMMKRKQPSSQVRGWWEAPTEGLSLKELEEINISVEMLQKDLDKRMKELTPMTNFPSTLNPDKQATNPFVGNIRTHGQLGHDHAFQ